MVAILGAVLGFLGSAFPELLKLYKDKRDKEHELKLLEIQMQWAAQSHYQRLEEINAQADVAESAALYRYASQTGIRWIDGLIGSVRPIVTYAFFVLYALVKYGQFVTIYSHRLDLGWTSVLGRIWTEEDMVIFSTIISFWFGSRAMHKVMRARAGKL